MASNCITELLSKYNIELKSSIPDNLIKFIKKINFNMGKLIFKKDGAFLKDIINNDIEIEIKDRKYLINGMEYRIVDIDNDVKYLYKILKIINENYNKYNVLSICDIIDCIDIDKLKEYVKDDINSNIEFFKDTNCNLRIASDKAEWMISKCCKEGVLVGRGSKGIDIKNKNIGIDVGVLCIGSGSNYTNEKSLIQNFTYAGDELDSYFKNKDIEKALGLFVDLYYNKHIDSLQEYELNKLYYVLFICNKKNVHVVCIRSNISNCKYIDYVSKCSTDKNISTENFISSDIGNVKLYKSKKRLELRLNKDIIKNNKCIMLY